MAEGDAALEFAIRQYSNDRLSLAKAAEMAGLDRIAFSRELAAREIPTMYGGVKDFLEEVESLRLQGRA